MPFSGDWRSPNFFTSSFDFFWISFGFLSELSLRAFSWSFLLELSLGTFSSSFSRFKSTAGLVVNRVSSWRTKKFE